MQKIDKSVGWNNHGWSIPLVKFESWSTLLRIERQTTNLQWLYIAYRIAQKSCPADGTLRVSAVNREGDSAKEIS
jgi:hypothetical protein